MYQDNLRKIRKLRGLSQLRLSFLTGIPAGDSSRIENLWLTKALPRLAKASCQSAGYH